MNESPAISGRRMLQSNWETLGASDQRRGVECPPLRKPVPPGTRIDPLPPVDLGSLRGTDLVDAIANRRSRRSYSAAPLTVAELSFLLHATQGVERAAPTHSRRPVPSAGARHPLETYAAVFSVEDLEPALYRYLPFDHALCETRRETDLRDRAESALHGQGWGAPVIFYWTAIPYRMEWRYEAAGHKLIALDAGHLCQNLYLACEAIGAGTCAIGAYDQRLCDEFLMVDGSDELTVYAAPVGKVG